MESGPVKKVVVVVVNKTVPDPEEFLEALFLWSVVAMRSQVPLAKERGPVSCPFQDLRHGDLLQSHIDSLGRIHVSLGPMVHTAALGMPPRHQSGTGRTANGVGISLGKAYPRSGKLVDIGSLQVI